MRKFECTSVPVRKLTIVFLDKTQKIFKSKKTKGKLYPVLTSKAGNCLRVKEIGKNNPVIFIPFTSIKLFTWQLFPDNEKYIDNKYIVSGYNE